MSRAGIALSPPGLLLLLLTVTGADAQVDANGTYAPVNITQEEKDLFLDVHNELRAKVHPEAANMMYMTWDEPLAQMAQAWSAECVWAHGQTEPNLSPYGQIGQNLYRVSGLGNRPSGRAVGQAWYNEIRWYTLETNTCQSGKVCGHYTQLAWANSHSVGCSMYFCDTASDARAEYNNVWIVTCNYGPAGNVRSLKPYRAGANCTKCESGVGECYNSLCRPCSDHTEECVCAQTCESCGLLDATSCSCSCPNGFQGADCSDICRDFSVKCGILNGGYPKPWCWEDDTEDNQFMEATCPATCELCVVDRDSDYECEGVPTLRPPPTTPALTTGRGPEPSEACVPLECQNDGAFDEESCRCRCPPPYQGDLCDQLSEPTHCPQPECLNGGRFDAEACRCRCAGGYQGKYCQHVQEEAANGVVVTLSANITRWDEMAPVLQRSIAEALTAHCNDHFEACCPGRGEQTAEETLPYADESNIPVANGYPEASPDAEGVFSSMFLARGLEEAELCVEGGSRTSLRRRGSDNGKVMHTRDATLGAYLDQGLLLEVVRAHSPKLTQDLADAGISATIVGVEAGEVDPPDAVTPGPYPGLTTGAIAGIAVGSLAVLVLCVGLVVFAAWKHSNSNDVQPMKAEPIDGQDSCEFKTYPTQNAYEEDAVRRDTGQ